MAWAIEVHNLQDTDTWDKVVTQPVVEKFIATHPEYATDLIQAMALASSLGLASATLSGGRTPSPYDDDEVVMVAVTGVMKATDFQAAIKRIINTGPDAEAIAEQEKAREVE